MPRRATQELPAQPLSLQLCLPKDLVMNQTCSLLSRSCACVLLLLTFTACSKSITDTPADPDAAITDPDATTGGQDGTTGGTDATDPRRQERPHAQRPERPRLRDPAERRHGEDRHGDV